MVETLKPSEIKVVGRHRRDLGDLTGLKESIARLGLLSPIAVTPDRRLIYGERRLRACEQLGRDVDAHVIESLADAAKLLEAERDENTERKPMTPSELVSLALELEQIERPRARERSREGAARGGRGRTKKASGTENRGFSETTREAVAKAVGMSESSYGRARSLVVAAKAGDKRAAALVDQMDRTGKVTPAYNAWKGRPSAPSGGEAKQPEEAGPDLWIPRWNDNTESAKLQRQHLVRHYADQGATAHQISEEIKLAPETVRQIAKAGGIEIRADKLLGRVHAIDSSRVARQVVATLDRAFVGVDLIDWGQIDPQEAASWLPELNDAVNKVRAFIKQVKEAAQ